MDDVAEKMSAIKAMENPSIPEIKKYIRYAINVLKFDGTELLEDVGHWNLETVERIIKDVQRENLKPKPKRYYVSLKEPLEEGSLR